MSSTNRGGQRSEADNYPTPAWCVDRLLERVAFPGGRWLEPCAGEGSIIRAVNARRQDVAWTAVELRQTGESLTSAMNQPNFVVGQDFLTWTPADPEGLALFAFDVILTNPPYSLARPFIDRCLHMAPVVAMPMRLNFLGSEDRAEWFRDVVGTPDVYVLPNRPDFSGQGGDSCEYAWLVWDRRHSGQPAKVEILAVTPATIRKAQKPKAVSP